MTKILVIDDDPLVSVLMGRLFRAEGYEVNVVIHSSEAIQVSNLFQPDLITLDLMMPPPDGFELCAMFREDSVCAGTPILIVTAKEDDLSRSLAFDVGANDYLTKPFDVDDLMERAKELLRGKRLGLYSE